VSNRRRFALIAAAALALAGCRQAETVRPALWQVDGQGGQRAWLFGTIHALPDPVNWRSAKVEAALASADRLVVEVSDGDDPAKAAAVFKRLGTSPGLPPLRTRLSPPARAALDRLLAAHGTPADQFDRMETWAAALGLNQLLLAAAKSDADNGVDLALQADPLARRIDQFEGLEPQLALFDRLPEADQRALLESVIAGAADAPRDTAALQTAWKRGDMTAIAALDHKGMLADPELRQMLLVERNRAWAARLQALLGGGARPFVAVGALHLAGPDGLPALLERQGYRVSRVQ
jgi:uncharacterized protein YbaP (TraB family)